MPCHTLTGCLRLQNIMWFFFVCALVRLSSNAASAAGDGVHSRWMKAFLPFQILAELVLSAGRFVGVHTDRSFGFYDESFDMTHTKPCELAEYIHGPRAPGQSLWCFMPPIESGEGFHPRKKVFFLTVFRVIRHRDIRKESPLKMWCELQENGSSTCERVSPVWTCVCVWRWVATFGRIDDLWTLISHSAHWRKAASRYLCLLVPRQEMMIAQFYSTRCRFRRSTKRYPYRHYRSWIIVRKRARLLKSQYVFFISLNSTFERGMSATKDDYEGWIVFFFWFSLEFFSCSVVSC